MNLSEHVVFNSEGALFNYTPLVLKAFAFKNVFLFLWPQTPIPFGARFGMHKDVELAPYSAIETPSELFSIDSFSNSSSHLSSGTKVGRYCVFGPRAEVMGPRHTIEWVSTSPFVCSLPDGVSTVSMTFAHRAFNDGEKFGHHYSVQESMPIIENDVWIGDGALLARNIRIGTGSVIAARAVVTKDVPPYSIVAGNPARVKKQRFDDKLVERLLASQWWDYDVRIFKNCDVRDPARFLDDFEEWKAKTGIQPYRPTKLGFMDMVRAVEELLQKEST